MKEKRIGSFARVWLFFAFFLSFVYFNFRVNEINGTMMAFSYKYGFISRGLIGSIYQLVDKILPVNMQTYDGLFYFTVVITVIYFAVLFAFFMLCLKKSSLSISDDLKYMILFFTIWAVPMFVSKNNFGRLDIYCFMFSLIGAMLLIVRKAEWLIVPISALGVMVHQGNVFMFYNIIMMLLLYRACSTEGNERKRYGILLGLSFITVSVLFLYFEFFSHMNGENILEEIVTYASNVCYKGKYHQDVIDHEILGIDLSEREYEFRLRNIVQFPIFVVLMLPYIIMTVKLFKNIIKKADSKLNKWKYIFVAIGAGTIVPDLLLKCDFGRWMFAIIAYYAVVIIALIAMNDTLVETEVKALITNVNEKFSGAIILLVYPFLMQPLLDVAICGFVSNIANMLNDAFLHLW